MTKEYEIGIHAAWGQLGTVVLRVRPMTTRDYDFNGDAKTLYKLFCSTVPAGTIECLLGLLFQERGFRKEMIRIVKQHELETLIKGDQNEQ